MHAYDGYSEYDDSRYDEFDRAAMRGAVKHEKTFAKRYFESKARGRQGAKTKRMRGNDFSVTVEAGASNGCSKLSSGSLDSGGNSKAPQVQHLERAYLSRVHSGSNVNGFVDVIDAATVENEACRRAAFNEFAVGGDHEGEEQRRADFADAYGLGVDDLVEDEHKHIVAEGGYPDDNRNGCSDADGSSGRSEVDEAGSRSDPGDGASDDDQSGDGTGDDYDDGPSDGYDDGDVGGDSGGYSPGERTPEGRGGYDSG